MRTDSVAFFLKRIFPNGTCDPGNDPFWLKQSSERRPLADIRPIPTHPADVFVAVASLIDQAGAYAWVKPNPHAADDDPFNLFGEHRKTLRLAGGAWAFGLPFLGDENPEAGEELENAHQFMEARYAEYKQALLTPQGRVSKLAVDRMKRRLSAFKATYYQKLWNRLVRAKDPLAASVEADAEGGARYPDWWAPALQLLILSDEAAAGLGFHPLNDNDGNPRPRTIWQRIFMEEFASQREGQLPAAPDIDAGRNRYKLYTLTIQADPSVACVLPKTRTPEVGCTLRSLSHHLALLPGIGRARSFWTASEHVRPPPGRDFNLLLIPFPFSIPASCFTVVGEAEGNPSTWFETRQLWLTGGAEVSDDKQRKATRDQIVRMVKTLLEESRRDGRPVHGVVFPEFALDWSTYQAVEKALADDTGVELLVTGLSQAPRERIPGPLADPVRQPEARSNLQAGNFVATQIKSPQAAAPSGARAEWGYAHYRDKHHRWRIDEHQLRRYGLLQNMKLEDDEPFHWEDIDLGKREIGVLEYRAGCTMTSLICEDLARIEPCQSMIRALGPNLVIVLLMDGPQTLSRWPNQYAGVLADDPGSSVLTLTSFGLIARSAASDPTGSRSIALWRDGTGDRRELTLPVGAHALVVSLSSRERNETTLDGRDDAGVSHVITLNEITPLTLPNREAFRKLGLN